LPAVELYELGESYYVLFGNHRVSVARYQGVRWSRPRLRASTSPCPTRRLGARKWRNQKRPLGAPLLERNS
jgi:hypothetical protein